MIFSGQILNRFSKDTGIIDELLSKNLMDMFQVFSTITAVIINVSIANPAMIVAILILAIIIYIGRNIYLNAAQKLKRIETSGNIYQISLFFRDSVYLFIAQKQRYQSFKTKPMIYDPNFDPPFILH